MAKKKVSNQPKQPQENIQPQHHLDQATTTIPPMGDQSEKLQSLKSLNSLLLKETHERRLQVEALIQSKKGLESELTRSAMEKEDMGAELNRVSDETIGLELEKCLLGVFMETQMSEMGVQFGALARERAEIEMKFEGLKREMEKVKSEGKFEIGVLKKKVNELIDDVEKERVVLNRAMRERDELKAKLGVQTGEANGLKVKVVEMEKRERKMAEQFQKQKMEYEGTVKDKMKVESAIKSLRLEKDLIEKSLRESMRNGEDLKREIGEILKEKNEIEEEMNGQVLKMKDLENEKSELIGTVMVLRDVEVGLHSKVTELEKSNAEVVESRERMLMEFIGLQEQKLECERKIETLLEEKSLIIRSLEVLEEKLEDQKRHIEGVIREKSEIVEVKAIRENEIVELQKELGKLKEMVVTLQETCKDQVEEKNRLESEISKLRHQIGRVTNEKDDVEKGFKKEKKNTTELGLKLSKMEKKVEESLKEMEQMKSEHGRIIEEKKELGSHCERVMGENVMLKKSLLECQEEVSGVKATLEMKCDNFKWVLIMLKNTAALANKLKDEMDENGMVGGLLTKEKRLEDGEEVQPYLVELEAIKDAFISKETKVEEMKRQLEFLQNSVVEANKKKSFWTLISSATTLLVAASVAYVARGH